MSDIDWLEQAIQKKLKGDTDRLQHERQDFQNHMAELAHGHELFNETAAKLLQDIVQPRVEALARSFDNARLDQQPLPQHFRVKCEFAHTSRFPASVFLTIGVTHDDEIRNVIPYRDIDILPIFFKFSPHGQMDIPLDKIDEAQVGQWVDQQILEFIDTYLRLEKSDQYQQQTLVTDPVCGVRIRKLFAAGSKDYCGKSYFFCTRECFASFAAAPQQYVFTKGE